LFNCAVTLGDDSDNRNLLIIYWNRCSQIKLLLPLQLETDIYAIEIDGKAFIFIGGSCVDAAGDSK